jgi:2-hydroxy-6-oxonona-2,4-dienedioate hydrolase
VNYEHVKSVVKENISMNLVCLGEYAIRYLAGNRFDSRSERILVLLHGIGASADRWTAVFPRLSRTFEVIIPDIVGFGYSDKPTVEYTMDFFVEFLDKFMKALSVEQASFIGSSFGGFLATEYALKYPNKVKKLVLVSPAGTMRASTQILDEYIMAALYPTYENVWKAFSNMTFGSDFVPDSTIRDFINRMRLPNAKYAFMSTLLGIRDSPKLKGRLSKIDHPTLFIWGEHDHMIPLEYSAEFAEISDSSTTVMKGCGHTPYVEKPKEFTRIVLDFLESKSA